jgi:hypothetical protein
MPPIDHSFHMSMEIQPLHAANGEPQPVAEGIFGRKKAPAATGAPAGTNGDSGHSEEAEATNASVVRPKNTVTNHLLPKDRPKQVKVPKFNAPKVSEVRTVACLHVVAFCACYALAVATWILDACRVECVHPCISCAGSELQNSWVCCTVAVTVLTILRGLGHCACRVEA